MRTTQRLYKAAIAVGICTMALGATVPAVGAATMRAHGHHTPPAGPTLTIGTTPLSAATVGTPYSATLTVTGATPAAAREMALKAAAILGIAPF